MPEDRFFRTQAHHRDLWRLVRLLAIELIGLTHHFLDSRAASVVPAGGATSRGCFRVAQDWEKLLRTCPAIDVYFLICNAPGRLHHFFMSAPTRAEFTLSVRWNLCAHGTCPQMRHMAEKIDRTLTITILHL